MERKRFLTRIALFGSLAFGTYLSCPEKAVSTELMQSISSYGLTTELTPGYQDPETDVSFLNYEKGALLRFEKDKLHPGWLRIVHDSWHNRPEKATVKEPIFIPESKVDFLDGSILQPTRQEIPASQKHIEVVLGGFQHMMAYEDNRLVFVAPVSGGRGELTPTGTFFIQSRQLSRHMQAKRGKGEWDHPGVPLVQTFGLSGEAFHAVYWHNNFGRKMSSGCINLRYADAEWLWRWTLSEPYPLDSESVKLTKEEKIKVEISYKAKKQTSGPIDVYVNRR